MTRDFSQETCRTCQCCMCRCGEHKCFQQMACKLPTSMQAELRFEEKKRPKRDRIKGRASVAELYRKSTYRKDFGDPPVNIDQFPLEQKRPVTNKHIISMHGNGEKDSTYRDDYIPWSPEDMELCRGKLLGPAYDPDKGSRDDSKFQRKISDMCRNYYCPTYCMGDKEQLNENCLLGNKEKFYLGPPALRSNLGPEFSTHPFAKYSNYMLDYRGSKLPPKRRHVQKDSEFMKSNCPMSSLTSYRKAFTSLPDISKPERHIQKDTLNFGGGPMIEQSTSMTDYRDPEVGIHRPERPPRDVYQPPSCRMETTTTSERTYKKWSNFPRVVVPKRQINDCSYKPDDTDIRHLVTTYQTDFDGVKSALCPCRVMEKYGPKVLEPRYSYTESNKLHDFFRTRDVDKVCHH